MAIKVKEIVEQVMSFSDGDKDVNGWTETIEKNATDEFKEIYNKRQKELKSVLDNDDATSTELIESLDNLVGCILGYRYNIVDYGHYCEDEDEHRCHLKLN